MQALRQLGAGIALSAFSVVIVIGGLLLALAEGGMVPTSAAATTTNMPTGEVIVTLQVLPLDFTNTPPGLTATTTVSPTPPPTLVNCPPPVGWLPIVVQASDTLETLSLTYHISTDLLKSGNCLLNNDLISGSILYVPPQATATLKPCGAPASWVNYTVVAGDTLYSISLRYQISWQELMQANCLETSYIKTGQVLKVPNIPVNTVPVPTNTTVIIVPSDTPQQPTLTQNIPSPTSSATVPAPTDTLPPATETPSATLPPSETPTPTETPTPEI